ncbi:hypothetical protein CTI12_AA372590 [Artemisia annua]|uniref:Uncharacterized protein n=1 Tax=Artemisia annua TaxID=35608 RepID=A0A2U1MJR2_ARTAN|nr:hypothetical protein CTI12_AA372590 [Artemisia annua]
MVRIVQEKGADIVTYSDLNDHQQENNPTVVLAEHEVMRNMIKTRTSGVFVAVTVFDKIKMTNKDGTAKRIIVTNTLDVRVATILGSRFLRNILNQNFGKYMESVKHGKAEEILNADVSRGKFHWQTDNWPNECGVFVMRHMESYMGSVKGRWECGLEYAGTK